MTHEYSLQIGTWEPLNHPESKRWRCSCGARGVWYGYNFQPFYKRWQEHVKRAEAA